MPIFGAVDFSQAACLLGYRVTVCDARPVFATVAPFPYADEVVVAGSAAPSSCAVKLTVGDAAAFPGHHRVPLGGTDARTPQWAWRLLRRCMDRRPCA